jgi:hypothetical protein
MPIDLSVTLRQALGKLEADKARIERQIAALEQALNTAFGFRGNSAIERPGRRMSSAARKAISARMKAYWAKRKQATSSGKKKGA